MRRRPTARLTLALALVLAGAIIDLARPSIAGAYCAGDCDANGTVSNGEYVDCRGIAFGSRPLSQCPRCDCDENGVVSDPDLLRAEQNASGTCNAGECPAATVAPGITPTSTPTRTSAIPTRTWTPTEPQSPSPTPATSATPTAIAGTCVGDCDGDQHVLVNEVVVGVNITLERAAVSTCPSFDSNATTTVSVDELVRGVNNVLRGCGS